MTIQSFKGAPHAVTGPEGKPLTKKQEMLNKRYIRELREECVWAFPPRCESRPETARRENAQTMGDVRRCAAELVGRETVLRRKSSDKGASHNLRGRVLSAGERLVVFEVERNEELRGGKPMRSYKLTFTYADILTENVEFLDPAEWAARFGSEKGRRRRKTA